MSKSILQDKRDRQCYLCMKLHDDFSRKERLEEHHVFEGTADRKRSEKMGLKIYLCPRHHQYSPEAIHTNARIRQMIEQEAQIAWMRKYMRDTFGTRQQAFRAWMDGMGKNYVDEDDW